MLLIQKHIKLIIISCKCIIYKFIINQCSLSSLQVLSIGGNLITEVPESVGLLSQLQALVLCDNLIESLPTSIARLKTLKSLLLHKNRLKHLPRDIVALKNLAEVYTIYFIDRCLM